MVYKVIAKRYGNSVEFFVSAGNIKEALASATEEAKQIFDYEGYGDPPTVTVKPDK